MKKSLNIKVKKAKNEMLIITAPDGEDYPCKDAEDVYEAITEIVGDEEQYKFKSQNMGFVEAEVVEEAPPSGEAPQEERSAPQEESAFAGDFTESLITEGLSFLLNKAQEASDGSQKSYQRFKQRSGK